MNPYLNSEERKQRLIAETRKAAKRMNRLNKFMASDDFPKLDRIDKDLLYEQQRTMSTLLQIYGKRIERMGATFSHEKPEDIFKKVFPLYEEKSEPEKTYRILQIGEITQLGDQFVSIFNGELIDIKTNDIYTIVEGHVEHRRPIQFDHSLDEESTFP